MPLAEVMRSLGVSHQTYQRWRSQYAAMRPDDVARLTTLEKENARLKRLVAEKELDNDITPCSPRENGDRIKSEWRWRTSWPNSRFRSRACLVVNQHQLLRPRFSLAERTHRVIQLETSR